MPLVDVTLGERELVRYSDNNTDYYRGWELDKQHRDQWNLMWGKLPNGECVVRLVLNKNVRLPENIDWDSDPIMAVRYSS